MTKRQYLNSIKKELKIFNEEKQAKYYKEYKNKYESLIKKGLTDEEVMKEMKDSSYILDEILEKEKKNSRKEKQEANKYKNIIIEEAKSFFNKLGGFFSVKTNDDLFKLLIDIGLILLAIIFIRVPFAFFKEVGETMFDIFPSFLSGLFSLIWSLFISILYFITCIFLIYYIIKKVFLNEKDSKELKSIKKDIKDKANEFNNDSITKKILKVLLLIITLPVYLIIFGLIITLGIIIGLIINGINLIGILIIVIALLIIFTSVIGLVNSIVFGGK